MREPAAPRTARLSAVVCTRNRSALLGGMLESLTRQTLDRSAFEVVIVDDGSTDDTKRVAESFARRLPLFYSYQRGAGLASAKNHGLFSTTAELVLFLDDDDLADPELFEQHVESHRRFPGDEYAVLGYTKLHDGLAADPLMHFATEVGCFLFAYPNLKDGQILDYTYFWGGRSSCKRRFLLDHGVFNPVFTFGCEDIELGFRLSRHGLKVVYNAHAVSTMARRIGFDGLCDRLAAQGRSNVIFSRLHPEEEIQQWTEVAGAEERWRESGPAFQDVMADARRLDAAARERRPAGAPLGEEETAALHRAYWAALRAAKLKGIHDALAS